ncbi:hypothetical protein BCV69DRAFT_190184 [Microstroma glucosiphilum]|uniref:Uncharacterized protein n=1 Tax=Pseudomicrostroma glucosiphilum TaxID=1684307 RepID=A0A316U9P2_9BASI|nr:hypothetical protein BCV69DRAFT_190184 [Pseudomicrostroma glucosiphilum]PWN21201.1 hypothetical protein BCV69DRAFT_190184 [Pseudomicrostroma glucosiphilum]
MDGRYYLSPSLLYSIRQRAVARGQGQDGDYEIPVEGEWVTIACVTGILKEWISGKDDEDGKERLEWYDDDQISKKEAKKRLERLRQEKDDRVRLIDEGRLYMLRDIGSQARGAAGEGGGNEGHHEIKLQTVKAHGQDKETGRYYGGTKGTYEKLGRYCHGQVIAIITPRISASKSVRDGDVMTLRPPDGASIVVLGNAKDYTSCTARTEEGEKCGHYVDRKGLSGSRAKEPICDFHLGIGVERTQRGRQEFANS